ncbi:MAG: hypothetical protein Q8N55_04040 [bacterium]|nr:hypothetical protein [bacterium]
MQNIVSLKELRQSLPYYADQVKKGNFFLVFKRSKPLFKISPIIEDIWEQVIDFTKISKGGVEINELLNRL